jgi:LDH2 family malate/lactate/ureidoglycolate dehydrogenase
MAEAGITVMPDVLRDFVTQVFQKYDMPRDEAEIMADHLVEADLRGVYSHGVLRVEPYVQRLKAGGMNPRPNVRILRETAGTALVDGDNGAGQVVGVRAMDIAIRKAREAGVGHVGVRMSNHFGTCAYFAMMALPHDMIGFAATVGGTNIMAPTGGITPLLGNNPFGYAIPAGRERPLVMDMALSVVAKGKIVHAMKSGTPIPDTWAYNKFGEPTTDAREAFEGLVAPVGGYKGYGMAFVTGIIAGLLNGAAFVHSVTDFYADMTRPQNGGHYFHALDIAAFMDPAEFKSKMDEAIQAMHSAEKARGAERVYVPGEMEWESREKKLQSGIGIAPAIWKELESVAGEAGIPLPQTV